MAVWLFHLVVYNIIRGDTTITGRWRIVMARKKTLTPKLYQRGANGNWWFRRFVNGKDKAFNTGTTVRSEAEAFVKQYISLEIEAANKEQRGELAIKTAQAIMLSVRGEGVERYSFEEAFKVYLDTTEDFMVAPRRCVGRLRLRCGYSALSGPDWRGLRSFG